MKRIGIPLFLLIFIPTILACGLTNTVSDAVTGGESYKPAADLWSDVPRMDGLTASELDDLPLPVKLLMRTLLGNLGSLNQEGEDRTTGNIDWIAFNAGGTPADVGTFYTQDLMAANGWESTDGSGCVTGGSQGLPEGAAFCSFSKSENGLETLLAIIATQENSAKPTSVFYLRLETTATPTP